MVRLGALANAGKNEIERDKKQPDTKIHVTPKDNLTPEQQLRRDEETNDTKRRILREQFHRFDEANLKGEFDASQILYEIDLEENPRVRKLLQKSLRWHAAHHKNDIDAEVFLEYLWEEVHEKESSTRAAIAVLVFVTFCTTVLLHENIEVASTLTRHVKSMIEGTGWNGNQWTSGHNSLFDVDVQDDVWGWMSGALMPELFHDNPEQIIAEQGEAELARVWRQSLLIGGMVLTQSRRKRQLCSDRWQGALGGLDDHTECFMSAKVADFTDDCFGPLDYRVRKLGERFRIPGGFCGDGTGEGYSAQDLAAYEPKHFNASNSSSNMTADGSSSNNTRILRSVSQLVREEIEAELSAGSRSQSSRDSGRMRAPRVAARRLRVAGRARAKNAKPFGAGSRSQVPYIDVDGAPRYTVMFSSAGGLPAAWEKVGWLQSNNWLDIQTAWVAARFLLFNPELSVYSHVSISFYFGLGGEMFAEPAAMTFEAEPYQYMSIIAADAAFLLMILIALSQTYMNTVHHALKGTLKTDLCRDPWYWIDVTVSHWGILMIGAWTAVYLLQRDVKQQMIGISELLFNATRGDEIPSGMTVQDEEERQLTLQLHEDIAVFTMWLGWYRVVLGVYCCLCMFGLFRGFEMQPRLAMVVNSLKDSFVAVSHHLILLFVLWVAFSVAAIFIFGKRLFSYSNLVASMNSCLEILFGSFQWSEMGKENWLTAVVWFWTYVLLCGMVLVNMFVALVMDAYGAVKGRALMADPIWTQARKWHRQQHHASDWIKVDEMEELVRLQIEVRGHTRVTSEDLRHMVPGLPEEQAGGLIADARRQKSETESSGLSLSEMCQLIGILGNSVKELDLRLESESERTLEERKSALAADALIWLERMSLESSQRSIEKRNSLPADPELVAKVGAVSARMARICAYVEDSLAWTADFSSRFSVQLDGIEARIRDRCVIRLPPVDRWDSLSMQDVDGLSNVERIKRRLASLVEEKGVSVLAYATDSELGGPRVLQLKTISRRSESEAARSVKFATSTSVVQDRDAKSLSPRSLLSGEASSGKRTLSREPRSLSRMSQSSHRSQWATSTTWAGAAVRQRHPLTSDTDTDTDARQPAMIGAPLVGFSV